MLAGIKVELNGPRENGGNGIGKAVTGSSSNKWAWEIDYLEWVDVSSLREFYFSLPPFTSCSLLPLSWFLFLPTHIYAYFL
jgi:hypothetical protein